MRDDWLEKRWLKLNRTDDKFRQHIRERARKDGLEDQMNLFI